MAPTPEEAKGEMIDHQQSTQEKELDRVKAMGGKYITDALLLKCSTNAKTKDKKDLLKKEGRSVYFSLISHMSLERQQLISIEKNEEVAAAEHEKNGVPELGGLKHCKKLEVLYLFENRLTSISETMLNFRKLTRLYMYDNYITKMENLDSLVNLQKLYLEKNMINRLEGLQNCTKLEELMLQEQKLAQNQVFTFDEYSLAAIAGTLYNLNLSGNNIVECKPLYFCDRLETLDLRGNWITDL